MGKRRGTNSRKEINQLSLAEELANEGSINVDNPNKPLDTVDGNGTGDKIPKDKCESGETTEIKRKSVGDDLLETLDIVVRLLQSVADQLSLATGKPSSGSNVNSLNELSWETAAFEKEIRDKIQWLGDKISSIRIPRVISQLMDFGREYARENPVTALVLLALCLTSSAPVLIFLVFAVATILVTFLGFLFVEGTLLTVATVIFGGVILVVGFITLSAVLVGMLGYLTTNEAYLLLTGRSRLFRILRKIPIIGRIFPKPKSSQSEVVIVQQNISTSTETTQKGSPVNGKVANGLGPHYAVNNASKNHFYVVDDDDDDDEMNGILDSDEELEDVEELEVETESPIVSTSSPEDLTLVEQENKEELDDDDEEDLGNQEIVSNDFEQTLKSDDVEEEGKIQFVDCAKARENGRGEYGDEETDSVKPPTPCIQLNGHHEANGGDDIPPKNLKEESLA